MIELIKARATLIIAALIVIGLAGLVAWGHHYKHKYEVEHASFEAFKEETKAVGMAAQILADKQKADDLADKQRADNEHKNAIDKLNADIKRLRDASARGHGLSAPAPSASSPDRTCFDPAKLSAALRSLDEGILGIVEDGSKAMTDLNNAKTWANEVNQIK